MSSNDHSNSTKGRTSYLILVIPMILETGSRTDMYNMDTIYTHTKRQNCF